MTSTSTYRGELDVSAGELLRIAVPNKGSLAEPASSMLREAGYRQRADSHELVLQDPDVGITGEDLLADSGAQAEVVLPLGFARSTFRFAAAAGSIRSLDELRGRRIA